MDRSGADLALLLLAGFRDLVEAAQRELDARGYPDHQAVHDFALRAIPAGADTASALGRRLSVSRQAAAKTIGVLERRGYVARVDDPDDARRKRLTLTSRGEALLRDADAVFTELRVRWEKRVGVRRLADAERCLAELVGRPQLDEASGWMLRYLDE